MLHGSEEKWGPDYWRGHTECKSDPRFVFPPLAFGLRFEAEPHFRDMAKRIASALGIAVPADFAIKVTP